jgi:hypothetical protein
MRVRRLLLVRLGHGLSASGAPACQCPGPAAAARPVQHWQLARPGLWLAMILVSLHGEVISKVFIVRFLARGARRPYRRTAALHWHWQIGGNRDLKRRAAFTSMADSDPWPPRPRPALNLKAGATRRVGKHNKLLRTAPRPRTRRRRCRDDSSRANLRQYRDGHTMQ